MFDKRIGHGDKWPETTINGAQYTRPVSTVALGNGYFAVRDTFGNSRESIAELQNLVEKQTTSKRKRKASKDDIQSQDD